ncbi:flagellar hook-basal body complex protein FliE [Paenibacillus sp. NPDC058071]|uniref:flagellar hook-basal body complex protein FliE n=1 Tax=Paenibacillus sp. NPDC058071 TaxID=3346326 RepID=UPI0036DD1C4C
MIQPLQLNQVQLVSKPFETNAAKQAATPAEFTQSFGQYLEQALNSVSAQEKNVHTLNDKFMIGEVDASEVLIAASQAQLGLSLTSQVRNKVVEAYQEIMRMQV